MESRIQAEITDTGLKHGLGNSGLKKVNPGIDQGFCLFTDDFSANDQTKQY
jgi:hypothetical protein